MTTIYEDEISDNLLKNDDLRRRAVEDCKWRIPVPYDGKFKYLVCYEDGRFLGFANKLDEASSVASEWIWNHGEGHIDNGSYAEWGKNHHYYVVDLNPESYWSKKFRAGKEELTPIDEYAMFSASQFYDPDYIKSVQSARNAHENKMLLDEAKVKEAETQKFWWGFLGFVVFMVWLFGGFSFLNP